MALDTRNARAAIFGLGWLFPLALPAPDGAIDVENRAALANAFSAVAAVTTVMGVYRAPYRRRRWLAG
jgi:hypothetical protein